METKQFLKLKRVQKFERKKKKENKLKKKKHEKRLKGWKRRSLGSQCPNAYDGKRKKEKVEKKWGEFKG